MSKNLKTACVIGHFAFGHNLLNGQTIKTKIVADELEKKLPGQVMKVDTHGGVKSLIKAPFQVFKALKRSKNVIILPAHNGLRVYAPLLMFWKKIFKERKLHYAVIGGWLAPFLESKKGLAKCLKKFDHIYVETSTMKIALEDMGFKNITIMPNCKELQVISASEFIEEHTEPYKLCTFSRVMKEKGIEDAVKAVKDVNEKHNRIMYSLDIYGQIDVAQAGWFEELQKTFPDYVRYGGLIPFDESVGVLKHYFALLFPTRFYTEGIPGTVIDAYAAGIPVISSKWESFEDIIDDGITGIGYEFGDTEGLKRILEDATLSQIIYDIKPNCIKKAEQYLPKSVIGIMLERI